MLLKMVSASSGASAVRLKPASDEKRGFAAREAHFGEPRRQPRQGYGGPPDFSEAEAVGSAGEAGFTDRTSTRARTETAPQPHQTVAG